jgi:hypothetical protein
MLRAAMRGLYVERRSLRGGESLSWDIAHHFYTRQLQGIAIVVTEKPSSLLSSTSRQWQKVVRQVQRERSSTLDATRVLELTKQIAYMQSLRMRVDSPKNKHSAGLVFASVKELALNPRVCHTMYVTTPLDPEILETITGRMPGHALVVCY